MRNFKTILILGVLALTAALSVTSFAAVAAKEKVEKQSAGPRLATGAIRKIEGLEVTIKHSDIQSIGMGPMTMTFLAKDQAMIKGFKAGDKVDFDVAMEGGTFELIVLRTAK